MELKAKSPTLDMGGEIVTHSFDIDDKMKGHILNILQSSIYTNPILAVIREYFCNAVDAHIEAKIPLSKIKIGLPTSLDPIFTVRDYGKGLDEHDINTLLRFYGSSTKQSNNDVIGGFGVGFKSGFSYCESFTINTVKNGRKYSFFVTKAISEKDKYGTGSINKTYEEETTEPSGVEISIPVKRDDVSRFITEFTTLYTNWTIVHEAPTVYDGEIEEGDINTKIKKFDGKIENKLGNCYTYYLDVPQNIYAHDNGLRTFSVYMGGIMYNIPYNDITRIFTKAKMSIDKYPAHGKKYYFVIEAKMGDVDISVSRETIQLSPKTEAFIIQKITEWGKKGLDEVASIIDNAKTSAQQINANILINKKWGGFFLPTYPLNYCREMHFSKLVHYQNVIYRGIENYSKGMISSIGPDDKDKFPVIVIDFDETFKTTRWVDLRNLLAKQYGTENVFKATYKKGDWIDKTKLITADNYIADLEKHYGWPKSNLLIYADAHADNKANYPKRTSVKYDFGAKDVDNSVIFRAKDELDKFITSLIGKVHNHRYEVANKVTSVYLKKDEAKGKEFKGVLETYLNKIFVGKKELIKFFVVTEGTAEELEDDANYMSYEDFVETYKKWFEKNGRQEVSLIDMFTRPYKHDPYSLKSVSDYTPKAEHLKFITEALVKIDTMKDKIKNASAHYKFIHLVYTEKEIQDFKEKFDPCEVNNIKYNWNKLDVEISNYIEILKSYRMLFSSNNPVVKYVKDKNSILQQIDAEFEKTFKTCVQ